MRQGTVGIFDAVNSLCDAGSFCKADGWERGEGCGKSARAKQHSVSSVSLQSDWRGLPIVCRSWGKSRTRPALHQVNFRIYFAPCLMQARIWLTSVVRSRPNCRIISRKDFSLCGRASRTTRPLVVAASLSELSRFSDWPWLQSSLMARLRRSPQTLSRRLPRRYPYPRCRSPSRLRRFGWFQTQHTR